MSSVAIRNDLTRPKVSASNLSPLVVDAGESDAVTDYREKDVLALQGGGALGAYQAGAYEALCDAGHMPRWVAGTSIGAVNAAIIAGNQPEHRVSRLTDEERREVAGDESVDGRESA